MASIINGRGFVGVRTGTVSSGPSIVTDGLKLYLDAGNTSSYPGTGTVWSDISGNGNNGTLSGPSGSGLPSYNSANGGSIAFDGTDDYGNLGSTSFFTGLINITVSIWVNPQTSSTTRWLFGRYSNTTINNGFLLYHETDNKFYFAGRESATVGLLIGTLGTYNVNNWYNLTVTKSSNVLSIYINGTLENSGVSGLGNVAFSANPLQLSALFLSNNTIKYFGKNKISNTLCYNRALSASEVLQNYNTLKSRYGL